MAVMRSGRNLRDAPSVDPTSVITPAVLVPVGKKVAIVGKSDTSFVRIKFTDDGGVEHDGWVPALTVNPEADEIGGPLNKPAFAAACVREAVNWGTSAHYLMSIAEMRTDVTDGPNANGVDVGPFALSPFEWAFYTALPDFELGITAGDIINWRSQCSVFAVMTLTIQQSLASLIGSQPTYSELYLAQIVGTKAAASAIANSTQALTDMIGAVAPADFKNEGIEAARISDRFTSLLKDATAAVALQRIDAALQQAFSATNQFVVPFTAKAAAETNDSAPSSSGPTVAPIGGSSYEAAAAALGVQVAMIRAFAEVESGGKSGFGPSGLPIIAFEGHWFRKFTQARFDKTNPLLSYPYRMKAGPEWQANNKNQATAWKTLETAMALDHTAAVSSCSWGMFQVMGFNYKMCGYADVDAFVQKMKMGQQGQLDAFVGFCKATNGLSQALVDKNFARCATLYNGPDFGDYDKRIERAFRKYGGT